MASPAKTARLKNATKGFTEVVSRGNNFIITRNPTNNKRAITAQVGGGWHYGEGLETDTTWETGTLPWNYQMTKAGYNLFALSNFKSGQIIKWIDPASGESITFQPMSLKWTNSINQIQQISFAQDVQAIVEDDKITWTGAYGEGRDFSYVAGPTRMQKLLKIVDPLPATSYDTLELEFIMNPSNGVDIIIDNVVWDKKSRLDTANNVQFRTPSGTVLWTMTTPTAFDNTGNETTGIMRLRKSGNSLYCSVRFQKSWLDTATYPIFIDPTIDADVSASEDDVNWKPDESYFNSTNTTYFYGAAVAYRIGIRFSSVTIPDGATINEAYLSLYGISINGAVSGYIYAENADAPTAITSAADGNSRTTTTEKNELSDSDYAAGWFDSGDISNIITELMNLHSYKNGAAMQMLLIPEPGTYYFSVRSFDYTGNEHGPILHIEYSEGSATSPKCEVMFI